MTNALNLDHAHSLPPVLGGTGTNTIFSQGSIPFIASSGIYSTSPTTWFWDSTNSAMFIGANTSTQTFQQEGRLNLYNSGTAVINGLNWYASADGYPTLAVIGISHNSEHIMFDCYYNGTSFLSSYSGSNFKISHALDTLTIDYSSSAVAGSVATFSNALKIDNTGHITIPTLTASQAVVANGSQVLSSIVYTNLNTASSLVERDASGNFSAGTISAALSGNATSATSVNTTAISTNASFFPAFVASSGGGVQALDINSGFTFNPSTNTLTASTFVGALSGNASTATTSTNTTNVLTNLTAASNNNFILFVPSSTNSNQQPNVSSNFTFNPVGGVFGSLKISGSQTENSVWVESTTNSGASEGAIYLLRGHSATGAYAQVHYRSAGTENFAVGLRQNDNNYHIYDAISSVDTYVITPGTTPLHTWIGNLTTNGTISISSATSSLHLKSVAVSAGSANGFMVTGCVLSAGTVTITNSSVTSSYVGIPVLQTAGGTVGAWRVSCGSGTFTITSTNTLDTSTLAVMFVLPN